MGFFNKLFSESEQRKNLRLKLNGVDFIEARNNINYLLKIMKDEAEQKGGQYCIKNEVAKALDLFMNNPCLENALPLLEINPSFIPLFEETKLPLAKFAKELKPK